MRDAVAATVASDDTPNFPKDDVIKKYIALDADLAHDEFKNVVSGQEFFLRLLLPSGLSAGSPAGSV